ncbi:hypothetical protein PHJA_002311700 [Phtheirospermum japonicum]|uniref:Uncharacterized protein n=1 Tax=Phtheirospermum japonicum TaxID=374723 RepID=A0A830CLY9_9LAMI|nr:hypothetical protein PHJA_002311700 [Phtheirospermum japonicum]
MSSGRRGVIRILSTPQDKTHFYCISDSLELESWDLGDPWSPRQVPMKMSDEEEYLDETEEEEQLSLLCRTEENLVLNSDDLFIVTRYLMEGVAPDGSYVDFFDERWEYWLNDDSHNPLS